MKRSFRACISVVLAAILCLSLICCSGRKKKYTDTYFDVFDSFATITVYDTSEENYERYNELFKAEIYRWHELLDVYNEYDGTVNLCTLNARAASEPIEVSPALFAFLDEAVSLYELTDGYASVSLGALTSLWKTAIENKTPPERVALEEAALHTDISDLILDPDLKTVHFSDSSLMLDAGAFAKGYAAKVIYSALIEAGCDSFLLNLGGTLCAHGQKNDGTDWRGGIQSPDEDKDTGISVNISGKALSTSGSYHRGFDYGGVRYHHIIDPLTLTPKNTYLSVSIICDDAHTADALSTALFSMTKDEGMALINGLGAEAVWIMPDGSITATDGINIPK